MGANWGSNAFEIWWEDIAGWMEFFQGFCEDENLHRGHLLWKWEIFPCGLADSLIRDYTLALFAKIFSLNPQVVWEEDLLINLWEQGVDW